MRLSGFVGGAFVSEVILLRTADYNASASFYIFSAEKQLRLLKKLFFFTPKYPFESLYKQRTFIVRGQLNGR